MEPQIAAIPEHLQIKNVYKSVTVARPRRNFTGFPQHLCVVLRRTLKKYFAACAVIPYTQYPRNIWHVNNENGEIFVHSCEKTRYIGALPYILFCRARIIIGAEHPIGNPWPYNAATRGLRLYFLYSSPVFFGSGELRSPETPFCLLPLLSTSTSFVFYYFCCRKQENKNSCSS